jgi:hypothetical protein
MLECSLRRALALVLFLFSFSDRSSRAESFPKIDETPVSVAMRYKPLALIALAGAACTQAGSEAPNLLALLNSTQDLSSFNEVLSAVPAFTDIVSG